MDRTFIKDPLHRIESLIWSYHILQAFYYYSNSLPGSEEMAEADKEDTELYFTFALSSTAFTVASSASVVISSVQFHVSLNV